MTSPKPCRIVNRCVFAALICVVAPTVLPTDARAAERLLIHAGQLLATPGAEPARREQTIIVDGERVVEVRDGFLDARALDLDDDIGVETIDLRDHFVLPGLMDAHVHLMWSGRDRPPKKAEDLKGPDLTLWTLRSARLMLGAGFTTVRELASQPDVVFAVRDWIDGGKFIGPRILAAGLPVGAHGGHGDMTGMDTDPGDPTASGLCSGGESCRRAVRMQHKGGADLIKMMATGGFSDNTGTEQLFFYDEMQATVEAAQQLGMTVATHAYAGDAIADAVRAGVDSIDHGFGADDDTLKLMEQRGVFLVPTLSIARNPELAITKLRERHQAFERALEIGTPIAFGTDVGGIPHQFAAREFAYMVELGMSSAAAIESATVQTARLFGIESDAGTIEPGKLADIIAVRGDPLEDVERLETVSFVMKGGRVAKHDGVMADFVLE